MQHLDGPPRPPNCRRWLRTLAAAAWLTGATLSAAAPPPPAPPTGTPSAWTDAGLDAAALEAEWLHTDTLRQEAANLAAPGRPGGVAAGVTPAQDALGGCDGAINGQWGFHTENEDQPWWQVDLGQGLPLDRAVLYNRCDACGERNTHIRVLLSDDGSTFRPAYEHNGTMFYGHPDRKPLVVALGGAVARYLRLQLPAHSYFHLDEVEVYGTGDGTRNLALGRPATQSSVSQWSVVHGPGQRPDLRRFADLAVERGLRLAADLHSQGVDVADATAALRQTAARLAALPDRAPADTVRPLYAEARGTVRRLALRNPQLAVDTLVFVKGAPTRFPHLSDQYYGWWSRPGGGVFLLRGLRTDRPQLRNLTAGWPEGSFIRPEVSYDGTRILFSYCRFYPEVADLRDKASKTAIPEDAFYHVYEMGTDGTGGRQLTRGRYDDFDARYLPDGDVVFVSTRKGLALQCGPQSAGATAAADLPDSYVRCGGDAYRPVPVFTLHAMAPDGTRLRPLSAFENFEWTPAVANDGRLLYSRWDYIDRFNGHFFSLWSTNANGTNPQLVYGNFTVRPQAVLEARPVPGSSKLVFTAAAHHSITGGSLVLFDRTRGTEEQNPITRLTPEVPFPETEAWAGCYYTSPYPLSETLLLCAWSDRRLPPHSRVDNTDQNPVNAAGLYLYDAFGNLEPLYRDPALSATCPVPLRPRPRPPVYADGVAQDVAGEGAFLVQDVYRGLAGVARGAVRRLRVVAVPPKVQPNMNSPNLGVSAEDPGKYVLGTVPVESDGSARFRVPSGVPVFLQALDDTGAALQTMRTLTYVWPGQTLACVGCHESRELAAPLTAASPLAARREPSRLRPGPDGSWPLRFDRLVQPVLDKSCVSCHRPGSGDIKAAALDLTPAKAYDSLLAFADGDLRKQAFERDRSRVGDGTARATRLFAILTAPAGHAGVRLDADAYERLVTWIDTYAQRQGHFSDRQEEQLRDFRQALAALLEP